MPESALRRRVGIPRLTATSALVSLLCVVAPAGAAILFDSAPNAVPLTVGGYVYSVVADDFDADGSADVVTLSASGLRFFRGKGDGRFEPPVASAGFADVSAVSGDFDEDGKLDVAALQTSPGRVRVYRGSGGAGAFTVATEVTVGGMFPEHIAVADVNRDGHLDLFVNTADAGSPILLRGTGTGTFAAPTRVRPNACFANRMVAADFTGDGDVDLAVESCGPKVVLLKGFGDGTFTAVDSVVVPPSLKGLMAARMDGDARIDLVTVDETSAGVSLNPAAARLGTRQALAVRRRAMGAGVADFDRDGRTDVVACTWDGTLEVLRGDGAGHVLAPKSYVTGSSSFLQHVAVSDFDGDGIADVASADEGIGRVLVAMGRPDGGLGRTRDLEAFGHAQAVAVADLDADGRPDLVAATDSGVVVRFQDAGGAFEGLVRIPLPGYGSDVVATDLDGDGDKDVAVLEQTNQLVQVYLNDGAGHLGTGTGWYPGTAALSMAAGDLNGDSRPELVVGNFESGGVTCLWNDGAGGFGAHTVTATGAGTSGVAIGRIDGDAYPDVIAANASDGTISVLRGSATGALGPRTDYATTAWPSDVAIGDLDGDGHADVVVSSSAPTVGVFPGQGDGTLGARIDVPAIACYAVGIGDADGDGKPDLWASHGDVAVMCGVGGLSFDSPVVMPGTPGTYRLALADLNGDGWLDAVTANSDPMHSVSVMRNLHGAPLGAGPVGGSRLALAAPWPNPSRGALAMSVTLADDAPASLDVFDLAGRRLAHRALAALGAGTHRVMVGDAGAFAPGIYLVRLSRGAESVTRRVAVVR